MCIIGLVGAVVRTHTPRRFYSVRKRQGGSFWKARRTEQQTQYNADQIQVLEGLEGSVSALPIHRSTDARGLHHLVYEVVDNAIDEALAGFATPFW